MGALLLGGFGGYLISNSGAAVLRADLDDARVATESVEEDLDDREDEIDELEDDNDRLEEEVEKLRRRLGKAEGTIEEAQATSEGLAAEITDATCGITCRRVRFSIRFTNESEIGGAVNCVFALDLKGGTTSHFNAGSPYVPAGGEDSQVTTWYAATGEEGLDTYDSDAISCERYGDI